MASPFSTQEIANTLRVSTSEKKTGKVWSFVATKDQGKCAKCKGTIKIGSTVEVSYDGVMAVFSHKVCPIPPPRVGPYVIQGAR